MSGVNVTDIRVAPNKDRAFTATCPNEAQRVMHHRLTMKVNTDLRRRISAAASRNKNKQAEWLRLAALEKLERDQS